MSSLKIKFHPRLSSFNFTKSELSADRLQFKIFFQMSEFIHQYLDIEIKILSTVIAVAAEKWQTEAFTSFDYFMKSTPQERLIVADKMLHILLSFFQIF